MKKIFVGITVGLMSLMAAISANAQTYYVSNSGNDANSGLTEETAWATVERVNNQALKAGDEILFEAGGVWSGCLRIDASGNKNELIRVDSYGNGAKPVINGDGEVAAVYMENQEYISINNLELTNKGTEARRFGVYIGADNCGSLRGIEIRNLIVHDVNGSYMNKYNESNLEKNDHWNGGIIAIASGDTVPTNFIGLTIAGCEVYNVARSGIVTFSNMYTAFDKEVSGMSQQLKIANNRVHDIKGDGIIVCGDYGGKVFGNRVCNTNLMSYTGEATSANVGMFAIHSTATHIFNNESCHSRTTHDGYGYDIDGNCDDVILEYNYSHDNEGGFLMLVNHDTKNVTVRYNISKNDKTYSIAIPSPNDDWLSMSGRIYNNTIYADEAESSHTFLLASKEVSMEIYNNIFDLNTGGVIKKGIESSANINLNNNLYNGNVSLLAIAALLDSNPIKKDPCFKDTSSVGDGYFTVKGFKLSENSPCIGAGIVTEDNTEFDFDGNKLSSKISIGAYQ